MRAAAAAALGALVRPGSRWLELGCGTGRDALALARRGATVLAADLSPGMLRRLRERIRADPAGRRVRPALLGTGELGRLLPRWAGRFDGVALLFGALNYDPDPAGLPPLLARLLRPGGAVVAAVRNRWCPWEIAYHLVAHPAPALAFRRLRPGGAPTRLGPVTVRMRVFSPRELARLFAPWFRVREVEGLCVALPPYMYAGIPRRWPRLERALERLEPHLARRPLLRGLGDHFLITLERRDR